MKTGEIVKEFLEAYPNAPSLTIAKMVNDKYPSVSVEKARTRIRYYRGASGDRGRNELADFRFVKDELMLPTEESFIWEPFIVKEKCGLVLQDIHFPFHDNQAIRAALNFGREKPIDFILLNGDIIDMYGISSFVKDLKYFHLNLQKEIDSTIQFFDELRVLWPDIPIYYKIGNHEERLERWLVRNFEIAGLRCMDLENLLNFKGFNITRVGDRRIVKFGKLNILHGHELGKFVFDPANVGRSVYNKTKSNTAVGHWHRKSDHDEPSLDDAVGCWSFGCLCYLKPLYNPINKWTHGFGYVRRDDNFFKCSSIKIKDGVVL